MESLQKYQITIKDNFGYNHTSEVSPEATVDEMMDAFIGLLVTSGYHLSSIEDNIAERADEFTRRNG